MTEIKPNDKAIDAGFEASAISVNGSVFGRVSRSTMKEILNAAYAAQFQSEDYAGLLERLRGWGGGGMNYKICNEAADAIEALLAERDELKGVIQSYQILLETQQGMFVAVQAERDALAARLAPVDDEALVEIVAKVLQAGDELEWSVLPEEWKKDWLRDARVAIAAIRPHIEAAEREKLQKMLARMGAGTTKTGAVNE